ncbi:MAG: glycosyltransferase family 39 protein [Flavobacteriales bacterium]
MRTYLHTIVLILIGGWALVRVVSSGNFERELVTTSDARGYYAYLPAVFIYSDPLFSGFEQLPEDAQEKYWVKETDSGAWIPKVTMGVAICMLPGFVVGHLIALMGGSAQDGWSSVYQLAIAVNGIAFLLLGIWFLQKWIQRYYPKRIAALTVLLLFFSTNLLFYGTILNAMSHNYSFSLFAMLLYVCDTWTDAPKAKYLIAAALTAGLMILIRPINVLLAMVPVVIAVHRLMRHDAWSQVRNWRAVLSMSVVFAPTLLQMIYWKLSTGNWIYYSYQQESFYFSNPHVVEGLFSFRNGWLVYTPCMILSLIGFPGLWKVHRMMVVIGIPVLLAYIYVVFSWWCWYYGDSLSIRAMIDIYPLLSLPMASIISIGLSRKSTGVVLVNLLVLLITNNVIQDRQYFRGELSGSNMTKEAFELLFFNPNPPSPDELQMIGAYDAPDKESLLRGLDERTARDTIVERQLASSGQNIFILNDRNIYSPALKVSARDFNTNEDRSLRITARIRSEDFSASDFLFVVSFDINGENIEYHALDIHKLKLNNNEWQSFSVFLDKPDDFPDQGEMSTYFWCRGKGEMSISEMKVEQINGPYLE